MPLTLRVSMMVPSSLDFHHNHVSLFGLWKTGDHWQNEVSEMAATLGKRSRRFLLGKDDGRLALGGCGWCWRGSSVELPSASASTVSSSPPSTSTLCSWPSGTGTSFSVRRCVAGVLLVLTALSLVPPPSHVPTGHGADLLVPLS